MYVVLTGLNELKDISLGVSIAVIFLLTITYIMLFFVWHFYYKKCIRKGLEDKAIKQEISKEYKKYIESIPLKDINENTEFKQKLLSDGRYPNYDLTEIQQEIAFKKKHASITLNIVLGSLYIILLAIFSVGLQSRINDGVTSYFGNSYLVIETGSMEEVHSSNTYIKENNLDNQIKQFSLIQLDKVEEKDMQIYDIYAFYNSKKEIIVHRLIAINKTSDGYVYTFKGDANSDCAIDEIRIKFDKIVGHYTGKSNFVLGITVFYLSSNIGLITIFFAFSMAIFFDIFEAKSNIEINKRKLYLLEKIFPRIRSDYRNRDLTFNALIEYKKYNSDVYDDNVIMVLNKDGDGDVVKQTITKVLESNIYNFDTYKVSHFKVRKSLTNIDTNIIFDIDIIDRRNSLILETLENDHEKITKKLRFESSLHGFDKKFVITIDVIDRRKL